MSRPKSIAAMLCAAVLGGLAGYLARQSTMDHLVAQNAALEKNSQQL